MGTVRGPADKTAGILGGFMKFNKDWLKKRWVENALALCIGVFFFVFLEHLGGVFYWIGKLLKFLSPVIVGIAIAYIIDPLARLFEHHLFVKLKSWRLKRAFSVTLALLLILALFVLLSIYLFPQLADSIKQFIDNLDGYSKSLKQFLTKLGEKLPINVSKVTTSIDNFINGASDYILKNKEVILSKSLDVGSGILTFLLGFILAIYFLFGKYFLLAGIKRFSRAAMSEKKYRSTMHFVGRCNRIMTRYLACDCLDSLLIGILNAIFMLIMKMPYIVLVSTVVGVTNLAPTFGPMVGALIGGFILLMVNPWYALFFLIFTLVLQTFDGYILKPKLFGEQLGLSSVMVLVFIILGGRMFGVLGVLLSIPLAAIVDFSYHDYLLTRLERKRGISDGDEETPEAESIKSLQEQNEREAAREERREERKEARKIEREQERLERGDRGIGQNILNRLKRESQGTDEKDEEEEKKATGEEKEAGQKKQAEEKKDKKSE